MILGDPSLCDFSLINLNTFAVLHRYIGHDSAAPGARKASLVMMSNGVLVAPLPPGLVPQ
jgi:hypothetical protein